MIVHGSEKIASLDLPECTVEEVYRNGCKVACIEGDFKTPSEREIKISVASNVSDCFSLQFVSNEVASSIKCGGDFSIMTNHGAKRIDDIGRNDLAVDVYGRFSKVKKKQADVVDGEWFEISSNIPIVVVMNDKYFMI